MIATGDVMGIYLQHNGQQVGPFTAAEVKSQLASGALSINDHVWWKGQNGWVPLGQSPLLTSGFQDPFGAPTKVDDLPEGLSPFALGSFLCSFISLIGGPLASIPGIVLGHIGLNEIKKNPKRTGKGLAFTGLVLNYIMTVVTTAILVSFFMFSDEVELVQARDSLRASETNLPTSIAALTNAVAVSSEPTNAAPDNAATNSNTEIEPPSPAVARVLEQFKSNAPTTTSAPATTNAPDTNANTGPVKE